MFPCDEPGAQSLPSSSLQDHVAVVLSVLCGLSLARLGTLPSRPWPAGFAFLPGAYLPAASVNFVGLKHESFSQPFSRVSLSGFQKFFKPWNFKKNKVLRPYSVKPVSLELCHSGGAQPSSSLLLLVSHAPTRP